MEAALPRRHEIQIAVAVEIGSHEGRRGLFGPLSTASGWKLGAAAGPRRPRTTTPPGPAAARSSRPSLSASKASTAVKRSPWGSPAAGQGAKRPAAAQVVPEGEATLAGRDQIGQAVVVEIGEGESLGGARRRETGLRGAVREPSLAPVVEHGDPLRVSDDQVEIAVAVEVARHDGPDAGERRQHRRGKACFPTAASGPCRALLKSSRPLPAVTRSRSPSMS